MCRESLILPLKMIFEAVLSDGVFPDNLKKVTLYIFVKRT